VKLFSRLFGKPASTAPALGEETPKIKSSPGAGALAVAAVRPSPDEETLHQLTEASRATNGNLSQALASIHDPAEVARLVVEGSTSRLRQLAAEAVAEPAQLRLLLKQVRHRDKSVYKIIKQKCDALNAAERSTAAQAAEVEALCASLETHSHRTPDAQYAAALERLILRWTALTSRPDPALEARAARAIARSRDLITADLREAAERAARQAEERTAREAQARVLEAARETARLQAVADAQRSSDAAAAREAEAAARDALRQAEQDVVRRIGGLVRKAKAELGLGQTQRAAGLRRAIEAKMPVAPPLPGHLTRQLAELDEQLTDLRQWKEHAVAPKRLELIAEMESLIGAVESPVLLAGRIKALRQQWRTIGKGIMSEAPEDAERFNRAAEAAYQPCREYFEAQSRLRRENLEHRKAVLERLSAFAAAQSSDLPDWRLIARVLRDAPQEWRRYLPVERDANRVLQADFDETLGRLQARLDAWHERNVMEKQSLVTRARHLLLTDGREAIEAMKRLQMLWKQTGAAPREQEQSLWNEFREVCDAVYQKRQQAFADYCAGLEAAKTKAVGLCEAAEQAAALSGPELLATRDAVGELRAAFAALDEMPRADSRGLQERFRNALARWDEAVGKERAQEAERSLMGLFEAGRHIQAYAWAVARQADAAEQIMLKHAAESYMSSVRHWPKGGLQLAQQALVDAESALDADLQANEKTLRLLCIRGEILGEIETPAEDEALRRDHQVRRLMQGMGQGRHVQDADPEALVCEWVRVGAVASPAREALSARFLRCWAARTAILSA
jgi:hypothetical protein